MISIIVPAYNAEKHIYKCICSICNQKYKDIEIIVVNDGSTDRTYEILDDLAKNDRRIKVINTKNVGASHARNIGIKNAKGEFIRFVDADDYLEANSISLLVKNQEETDAQLVIGGYAIHQGENHVENIIPAEKAVYSQINLCIEWYQQKLLGALWNKLFKRELITAYFNQHYCVGEDLLFVLKYLNNASTISILNEIVYEYELPAGQNNLSLQYHLSNIDAINECWDAFFDIHNIDMKALGSEYITLTSMNLLKGVSCGEKKDNLIKEMQKMNRFLYQKHGIADVKVVLRYAPFEKLLKKRMYNGALCYMGLLNWIKAMRK